MDTMQKPPTEAILAVHEQLVKTLPMHDEQDFEDARRGYLGTIDPPVVRDAQGKVVWDAGSYGFLGVMHLRRSTRACGGSPR